MPGPSSPTAEAAGMGEAASTGGPTYRGWSIGPDYIGWSAASPNFDASYEGDEDGWVSNGESAWGRARAECEAGVDEWFEEHGDAPR